MKTCLNRVTIAKTPYLALQVIISKILISRNINGFFFCAHNLILFYFFHYLYCIHNTITTLLLLYILLRRISFFFNVLLNLIYY